MNDLWIEKKKKTTKLTSGNNRAKDHLMTILYTYTFWNKIFNPTHHENFYICGLKDIFNLPFVTFQLTVYDKTIFAFS